MDNNEEKTICRIQMNNWPVSFSEWYEAYITQVVGPNSKNNVPKISKDAREGLMDKLIFRARILLDPYAEDAKQGRESVNWIIARMATFFLENEDSKEQFLEWRSTERDKVEVLNEKYWNQKKRVKEFEKEHKDEFDRWDRWDKINDDEVMDCLDLMIEYGDELLKLDELGERLRKNYDRFLDLDSADFLNSYMLKTVSQIESDFYCNLLERIPSARNKLEDLKHDRWWNVDVNTREELLRCIELLMMEEKWNFIEDDFGLIAKKLLRPHEYILTKEAVILFRRVSDLYSIGDSRIVYFGEDGVDNIEDCLEIEYSDILDSEMSNNDKEEEEEKTKSQKILELAEKMRALSRELSVFIDENAICLDLTKELEIIYEEDYKNWKIKQEKEKRTRKREEKKNREEGKSKEEENR